MGENRQAINTWLYRITIYISNERHKIQNIWLHKRNRQQKKRQQQKRDEKWHTFAPIESLADWMREGVKWLWYQVAKTITIFFLSRCKIFYMLSNHCNIKLAYWMNWKRQVVSERERESVLYVCVSVIPEVIDRISNLLLRSVIEENRR